MLNFGLSRGAFEGKFQSLFDCHGGQVHVRLPDEGAYFTWLDLGRVRGRERLGTEDRSARRPSAVEPHGETKHRSGKENLPSPGRPTQPTMKTGGTAAGAVQCVGQERQPKGCHKHAKGAVWDWACCIVVCTRVAPANTVSSMRQRKIGPDRYRRWGRVCKQVRLNRTAR